MSTDPFSGRRFHVETLGCPKNAVDSEKVIASLLADRGTTVTAISSYLPSFDEVFMELVADR